MTEYQVLVDLIMGEARICKPGRDIQLTVLMVDGDGKAQPLPLPATSHELCIPEVILVDLNQVDDDRVYSFGSDEPTAQGLNQRSTSSRFSFLSQRKLKSGPRWRVTENSPPISELEEFLSPTQCEVSF